MKAISTWAATTITSDSALDIPVSVVSASAPLTLLTANQPIPATTALSPAGSALPHRPKAMRLNTICGTPNSGPRAESTPWVSDPSAVPSTIAATAAQKLCWKNRMEMTPTKTVANSRFGDIQVQNSWPGRPCRSSSAMNSAPPGSTATTFVPYCPSRTSAGISTVVMRATVAGSGVGRISSMFLTGCAMSPDVMGD